MQIVFMRVLVRSCHHFPTLLASCRSAVQLIWLHQNKVVETNCELMGLHGVLYPVSVLAVCALVVSVSVEMAVFMQEGPALCVFVASRCFCFSQTICIEMQLLKRVDINWLLQLEHVMLDAVLSACRS
jgi:hypothetical protein